MSQVGSSRLGLTFLALRSILPLLLLADNTNPRSLASRLRRRRFWLLAGFFTRRPAPITVLDLGGTQAYWQNMLSAAPLLAKLHVTLLNLQPQAVSLPNFVSLVGDARALPQFAERQFDLVFSNSTLEHVGSFDDQAHMAAEVQRLGQAYYVQTPNRYFPLEPHFLFPFFQFLPLGLRVGLVRRFRLGWFPKLPDPQEALAAVASIRLLTKAELQTLFPTAALAEEKFLGLTKSFIAHAPGL
jgi:hypothetical protein